MARGVVALAQKLPVNPTLYGLPIPHVWFTVYLRIPVTLCSSLNLTQKDPCILVLPTPFSGSSSPLSGLGFPK